MAPWGAVLLFWVGLESAWGALLCYHAQVVVWGLVEGRQWKIRGQIGKSWALILPTLLVGVGAYYVIPELIKVELGTWLQRYGLEGWSFVLMVFYFGLVHPWIEQYHWRSITDRGWWGHVLFAGYHILVVMSLMPTLWVVATFVVLCFTSVLWERMYQREGTLVAPTLLHIFADFGMILAVWALL